MREAAARITPGDISQLRQLLLEEGRLMSERGQTARRAEIKASGDFHLMLAEISGTVELRFRERLAKFEDRVHIRDEEE